MEIEKVYEPQRFEPHWAARWVDEQLFSVQAGDGPRFSLAIPPPNVTGSLHMGHMFEHAIIDALIRWHRMLGERTLWLPGTDHAGIATELMVDRQLQQEGKNKRDLPRPEFIERVWKWKEQHGGRIVEQMKRAGVSCDWTRERFTMDPGLSRAVREVFVRLYEEGLIYQGDYMVNWCPRCRTVLSDLEVEHEDTQGSLWNIVYPLKDSSLKLVVATTRPETMLGDTAVAINPEDPRAAGRGIPCRPSRIAVADEVDRGGVHRGGEVRGRCLARDRADAVGRRGCRAAVRASPRTGRPVARAPRAASRW